MVSPYQGGDYAGTISGTSAGASFACPAGTSSIATSTVALPVFALMPGCSVVARARRGRRAGRGVNVGSASATVTAGRSTSTTGSGSTGGATAGVTGGTGTLTVAICLPIATDSARSTRVTSTSDRVATTVRPSMIPGKI